jgi:hypothetical protein
LRIKEQETHLILHENDDDDDDGGGFGTMTLNVPNGRIL